MKDTNTNPPPTSDASDEQEPSAEQKSLGEHADWGSLAAGAAAVLYIPLALWPEAGFPAWPSVSLGLAAMGLSWLPGRPLFRGLGAFLGLVGAVVGGLQIAASWALLRVWPGG